MKLNAINGAEYAPNDPTKVSKKIMLVGDRVDGIVRLRALISRHTDKRSFSEDMRVSVSDKTAIKFARGFLPPHIAKAINDHEQAQRVYKDALSMLARLEPFTTDAEILTLQKRIKELIV